MEAQKPSLDFLWPHDNKYIQLYTTLWIPLAAKNNRQTRSDHMWMVQNSCQTSPYAIMLDMVGVTVDYTDMVMQPELRR